MSSHKKVTHAGLPCNVHAMCNPIQSWNALLVKEIKGIGKSGQRIDQLRQRCNRSPSGHIVACRYIRWVCFLGSRSGGCKTSGGASRSMSQSRELLEAVLLLFQALVQSCRIRNIICCCAGICQPHQPRCADGHVPNQVSDRTNQHQSNSHRLGEAMFIGLDVHNSLFAYE